MNDSFFSKYGAFILNTVLLFIFAACVGAVVLLLARYTSLRQTYEDLMYEYASVTKLSSVQSTPRYGIVQTIDPVSETIGLRIQNRYTVGGAPYTLTIHITEKTAVFLQELVSENGIYSRTHTELASIKDLRVGDKAAVSLTFNKSKNDRAEATVLFFGNPL